MQKYIHSIRIRNRYRVGGISDSLNKFQGPEISIPVHPFNTDAMNIIYANFFADSFDVKF